VNSGHCVKMYTMAGRRGLTSSIIINVLNWSMMYWSTIQIKTVSPSELFPCNQILFAYGTFRCKGWNSVHRNFPSQWGCPRLCPKPFLYLVQIADLPASSECTRAKFADDTAVLGTDSDPAIATRKLQANLETKLIAPGRPTSHSLHEEKHDPGSI
jgi:hypothetical protein